MRLLGLYRTFRLSLLLWEASKHALPTQTPGLDSRERLQAKGHRWSVKPYNFSDPPHDTFFNVRWMSHKFHEKVRVSETACDLKAFCFCVGIMFLLWGLNLNTFGKIALPFRYRYTLPFWERYAQGHDHPKVGWNWLQQRKKVEIGSKQICRRLGKRFPSRLWLVITFSMNPWQSLPLTNILNRCLDLWYA